MMIDQAQNEATISITSFTTRVERANNAHMEKSISCANARVSASICLLFIGLAGLPALLGPNLPYFQRESQHIRIKTGVIAPISEVAGGYSPEAAPAAPPHSRRPPSPPPETAAPPRASPPVPSPAGRP